MKTMNNFQISGFVVNNAIVNQCATASAHIGHRRRTEKDEGQKKVASQTGTGTETGQPRTYQKENQTTVTLLHEKNAQKNSHHDTELKAAKPDKRKGQVRDHQML